MDIDDILEALTGKMVEDGVSRSELSRMMGLHRSTVTNFFHMNNRDDMLVGTLNRYCDVLGMELVVRGAT